MNIKVVHHSDGSSHQVRMRRRRWGFLIYLQRHLPLSSVIKIDLDTFFPYFTPISKAIPILWPFWWNETRHRRHPTWHPLGKCDIWECECPFPTRWSWSWRIIQSQPSFCSEGTGIFDVKGAYQLRNGISQCTTNLFRMLRAARSVKLTNLIDFPSLV